MKYLVLSDIHGNLQALQAVLARALEIGYDRCVCLGDVIGYGANPIECWDAASEVAQVIVRGNHEDAIINGLSGYSTLAIVSLLWTGERLRTRADIIPQLRVLPLEWTEPGVRFVHASPWHPDRFVYVRSEAMAAEAINAFEETICFIGHTHYPWYAVVDGLSHQSTITSNLVYGETIRLWPQMRCLVNVGAVGQPRDGNPNARFVIYDTAARTVTFHEVPYDISAAQAALIRTSLPPEFAAVLANRLQEAR